MPSTIGYAVETITDEHRESARKARGLLRPGQEHRQAQREETWRRVRRQYEGKHWTINDIQDATADLTQVNISFATVQTIKPYITGNEPRFYLEPFSTDATRTAAALQEVFLNRLWRHPPVGAQAAVRKGVFDYLTFGDGFVKASYTIDSIYTTLDQEEDVANIHIDHVDIWDVWIDQYASSVADARWVAHRIWTTEREIRNDSRYKVPTDFIFGDRSTDSESEARPDRSNLDLQEDDTWVELIEFYDQIDKQLVVFPNNSSDDDDPWRVIDDVTLPIVQLPNYEITNSPWHMGDLEQISQLQEELNKTRSELMTHRRRNVAKLAVKKGVASAEAKTALQSSIVNEVVELDTQEPLPSVFQPIQMPPITADVYTSSREIKDDIREITGVTEYQRGVAPDITRTATEASIMDASANVKLTAKLTIVEEASRELGSLILAIAREVFPQTRFEEWAMFIGGDEAKRLNRMSQADDAAALQEAGDMAAAAEVSQQPITERADLQPSADMFVGEYEVLVQIGSTEYRDPKLREERLKEMFFSMMEAGPQLQQMGVNFDLGHMLRLWLESTDLTDVDSLIGATVDPAAQGAPQGPPQGAPPQGQQDPMAAMMAQLGAPGAGGQPAPDAQQTPANTGQLESGEIAPATLGQY